MGSPAAALLELALTRPGELAAGSSGEIAKALAAHPGESPLPHAALAAVAYGRPELLSVEVLQALGNQLQVGSLEAYRGELVMASFSHLAHTPLAGATLDLLLAAARTGKLYEALGAQSISLLDHYRQHHPLLWTVELALDALPHEAALANSFLGRILEPLAIRDAAVQNETVWRRLVSSCAALPRWKYCLAALAERAPASDSISSAVASLPELLAHRGRATALLSEGPLHVVVLLNVSVGQGDELIRVAPLVQGLLDSNSALRVTLVTSRAHLYDDPRVRVLRLDDPQVSKVLLGPCDVRFVVTEPAAHQITPRPDIAALEELTRASAARALTVHGDVSNGYFLFRSVHLAGEELALASALDRIDVPGVYDPTWRLLAELGLPARCGSEVPRTPSFLVGQRSLEAEQVWAALTGGSDKAIALVQPFGGWHPLKGYLEQHADNLAHGLEGLIEEGYRIVLLPNGEAWGGPAAIASTLARLSVAHRLEVAVAPDPASEESPWNERLSERAELNWADRVMRLHKYFASYAGLIVTIEGWLGHLAYQLGRPLRIVLRTQSDISRWYPHLRSTEQVIADRPSPRAPAEAGEPLGETPLPLPGLARHGMLISALAGLTEIEPEPAAAVLLRVVDSRDRGLRSAALRALACATDVPGVRTTLLEGLRDSECGPRGAAAYALLAARVDCRRELGVTFELQLQAHVAIAHQAWSKVLALGTPAVPAVARAIEDEDSVIRREARWAMSRLLLPVAPRTGA